jgi:hypothetical protein
MTDCYVRLTFIPKHILPLFKRHWPRLEVIDLRSGGVSKRPEMQKFMTGGVDDPDFVRAFVPMDCISDIRKLKWAILEAGCSADYTDVLASIRFRSASSECKLPSLFFEIAEQLSCPALLNITTTSAHAPDSLRKLYILRIAYVNRADVPDIRRKWPSVRIVDPVILKRAESDPDRLKDLQDTFPEDDLMVLGIPILDVDDVTVLEAIVLKLGPQEMDILIKLNVSGISYYEELPDVVCKLASSFKCVATVKITTAALRRDESA